MSFTSDTYHVAKKAHRCHLCGKLIPVGERYNKRAGVSEGDFWSIHMHCFCSEVATEEYRDNDAWEFHDEYEFREILAHHERKRAASL